jgi:hypothetical protein
VQLISGNITALKAAHIQKKAFGSFNPWQLTTAIKLLNVTDAGIESTFIDPVTLVRQPVPQYGPNITLTERTYKAKPSLHDLAPITTNRDRVPVTHLCTDGCGGGLINGTSNAYLYHHGTCVDPDVCECILRVGSAKPAFTGKNCEQTLCDVQCKNGACEYHHNDTSCGMFLSLISLFSYFLQCASQAGRSMTAARLFVLTSDATTALAASPTSAPVTPAFILPAATRHACARLTVFAMTAIPEQGFVLAS